MFEYTALVDAPVKRFTSIVTDPEPDDAPVIVAIAAPAALGVMPLSEVPVMLLAVEPEAVAEPVVAFEAEPTPPVEAAAAPGPAPLPAPALPPRDVRTFVPRAEPAPPPSIVPALIGIAAAGITAFWWMRRESHGRGR